MAPLSLSPRPLRLAKRPKVRKRRTFLLLTRLGAPPETKITWTLSCRHASTLRAVSFGSSMCYRHPLLSLTWCTSKTSLKRSYKNVKPERQVSARFAKSSTLNALMNWSARSLSIALKEVSCWSVFVMKLRWRFRPIRRFTRALLPTAWERPLWQNRARTTWTHRSKRSRRPTRNKRSKSRSLSKKLQTRSVWMKKNTNDCKRATTTK